MPPLFERLFNNNADQNARDEAVAIAKARTLAEEVALQNRIMEDLMELQWREAQAQAFPPMYFNGGGNGAVGGDGRNVGIGNANQMQEVWFDDNVYYKSYEAVPFTPEPEKEVEITEDDELPVNYDLDDDAEKAELPENMSFYANTKGKLEQVSEMYLKLTKDLLPFLEKDKFFVDNNMANEKWVEQFLIHALWSYYRSDDDKKKNDFTNLKELKRYMVIVQSRQLYGVVASANTYVYKNMEDIINIAKPVFDKILELGDIRMNPKTNEVNITVNGEQYKGTLNPKKKVASTLSFTSKIIFSTGA